MLRTWRGFSAPRWAVIPNLAVDLILPPLLMPCRPTLRAGWCWRRRCCCRWEEYLPTIAPCSGAGGVAAGVGAGGVQRGLPAGLVNSLLGVAAALALGAVWVRWRERHPLPVIAGTAVGVVVVFFCHIMALALLAALMFGYEVDRLLASRGRTHVAGRMAAALVVFVPAILFTPWPRPHGPAGRRCGIRSSSSC